MPIKKFVHTCPQINVDNVPTGVYNDETAIDEVFCTYKIKVELPVTLPNIYRLSLSK